MSRRHLVTLRPSEDAIASAAVVREDVDAADVARRRDERGVGSDVAVRAGGCSATRGDSLVRADRMHAWGERQRLAFADCVATSRGAAVAPAARGALPWLVA